MRPDEHKKRKNDLYKKKHGIKKDTSEKKKTWSNEKTPNNGAESSKESNVTKPNNEPKASHSDEDSKSEDEIRKFSRRKIESNWSRYDEILSDEEEIPMQRGEDFNKLFAQAGGSAALFRFKGEEDWASVEGEATDNLMALDLQDLAQALDCVPLQERLGLNQDLFSDEQLAEMRTFAERSKDKYDKLSEQSTVPKIESVTKKKSFADEQSSRKQHKDVSPVTVDLAPNYNASNKKTKEILDLEQDIDALLNDNEDSKTVTCNSEKISTGLEETVQKTSVPNGQISSQKTGNDPAPSKNLEDWLDDFLDN
ncbi:cell death regulator Aven-like isoform X2 [Dreissena polymorpha]|uniref:Cell death regulator Aven n=1 Tax=Dreissena polymorpha TaxID=45954 RepID=A0A9D4KUX9_DREPO|nr:cell death regulator Aven-like isoform X2 [Dreissena polymorpha]KAH3846340.1 hypothetical protein DPMN_088641 [Dreissena polymorpha]